MPARDMQAAAALSRSRTPHTHRAYGATNLVSRYPRRAVVRFRIRSPEHARSTRTRDPPARATQTGTTRWPDDELRTLRKPELAAIVSASSSAPRNHSVCPAADVGTTRAPAPDSPRARDQAAFEPARVANVVGATSACSRSKKSKKRACNVRNRSNGLRESDLEHVVVAARAM